MKKIQVLAALAVSLAALCIAACATSYVYIPADLSPSEIIQRAQEASDRNRYNVALQYYEALLERNPTNTDLVCTAEYQIAFIHYKQKKYPQARDLFDALLERYDAPGGEYLPPAYRILARKVLVQIDEKENPRRLFSKKPSN
jgi:outer membrane protein assembly factor BamD (BamD/ComL family)